VNAGSALLGVPLFVVYLHFGVIRREEGFLERRFGEEYVTYTMRVPRWVPQLTDR
jgi:protein-S-isoprenylcysteine O-methyltransferase Ste14